MLQNLPEYVLAVGALGTASFALVDGSKVAWGGISNCGFGQIDRVLRELFPRGGGPLSFASVRATLRANWLNGTALGDQKLIAKTLIKLHLNARNAAHLAKVTGVDEKVLAAAADKITTAASLSPSESDAYGRFDLILTTLLDEGYQRADQIYRNSAKAWSVVVSLVLAFLGGWTIAGGSLVDYVHGRDVAEALLVGLLATPLAPISKDISSALSAASRAIGLARK